MGDIVFIEVEMVGEDFDVELEFGMVEVVKIVFDLFMLVFGKVFELNGKLDLDLEIVNVDFYGEGWIIKVEMFDLL